MRNYEGKIRSRRRLQRAGERGNPAAAAVVPLSEHFGEEPKGSYPLAYFERPVFPASWVATRKSSVPERDEGLFLFSHPHMEKPPEVTNFSYYNIETVCCKRVREIR